MLWSGFISTLPIGGPAGLSTPLPLLPALGIGANTAMFSAADTPVHGHFIEGAPEIIRGQESQPAP
jgi:hypothetical protein